MNAVKAPPAAPQKSSASGFSDCGACRYVNRVCSSETSPGSNAPEPPIRACWVSRNRANGVVVLASSHVCSVWLSRNPAPGASQGAAGAPALTAW
jgi:hypothetical protein